MSNKKLAVIIVSWILIITAANAIYDESNNKILTNENRIYENSLSSEDNGTIPDPNVTATITPVAVSLSAGSSDGGTYPTFTENKPKYTGNESVKDLNETSETLTFSPIEENMSEISPSDPNIKKYSFDITFIAFIISAIIIFLIIRSRKWVKK